MSAEWAEENPCLCKGNKLCVAPEPEPEPVVIP